MLAIRCCLLPALRCRLAGPKLLPRFVSVAFSSEAPSATSSSSLSPVFTAESDPLKHGERHRGRLYKVPSDISTPPSIPEESSKALPFFPRAHSERSEALDEGVILIRRPALSIFDMVRRAKLEEAKGPLKFVLYGNIGEPWIDIIMVQALSNKVKTKGVPNFFLYGN